MIVAQKLEQLGFKSSEGIEVPIGLADKVEFAKQRSKLAGIIRGSYSVVKYKY